MANAPNHNHVSVIIHPHLCRGKVKEGIKRFSRAKNTPRQRSQGSDEDLEDAEIKVKKREDVLQVLNQAIERDRVMKNKLPYHVKSKIQSMSQSNTAVSQSETP